MLNRVLLLACLAFVLMTPAAAPFTDAYTDQSGGTEMPNALPSAAGIAGGDLFPGHDPNYIIINLTDNDFGDSQPYPNGYYIKYAGFNSTGTRIAVTARNRISGINQPYEIWVMDYNPVTQNVSNYIKITGNGGLGDTVENTMPVWSESNPDLLMYVEVHLTTGNILKTFNMSTGILSTIYDSNLDPAVADCGNEDFLGTGTDVIFGDYMASGESDIYQFNGNYNAVRVTTNADVPTERVDASSNYNGTRIIYYSGSSLYSPGCDIGGIVFSDYNAGQWWENPAGFGNPTFVGEIPGYWAAFSGRPDDKILASLMTDCWSGNSLGLFDAAGNLMSDLVGSPGTDWKFCFGWQSWEGPQGEILFRAEENAPDGYGNNLFIAQARPSQVWVDDDWDGPENCGGHAWDFDAYDNIEDAIDVVTDGGTVNVASGIYAEQVVIDKSLVLQGTGGPIIQAPVGSLMSYMVQESGSRFEPLIFAYGGTDDGLGNISGLGTIQVTISGFEIDGNNAGAVNRFTAILARNCQASVISYNDIYDMLYLSGQPQTSGILVYGNSSVSIDHNTVNDWTRGGIVVNGDNGPLPDPIATVSYNTVVGEGPLPVGRWAQNGIQIGYGASGAVNGNEVSDIICLDPNWSASGLIVLYPGGDVILDGNYVHDVQGALNAYYVDNLILNENIFEDNDFAFIWGGNNARITGNRFDGHIIGTTNTGLYMADVTNAAIDGNTFSANQYGIIADGACVNLLFNSNNIIGNTIIGAAIQPYGSSPTGVVFHENNISANLSGIDNATTNMIDATSNWWGDSSGPNGPAMRSVQVISTRPILPVPIDGNLQPYDRIPETRTPTVAAKTDNPPSILLGTGDPVSVLVDYSPWWGANYVSDPHASPWQWCVDISNGSTIQEGVSWATAGDFVHVYPGTYHENIAIDKSLTIKGDRGDTTIAGPGPAAPTLDGTGYANIGALRINQDVTDVTIEGFEIRNFGPDGSTNANAVTGWNSGTSNIIIRDNFLHHLGYAGILTGNGWGDSQGLHDNWTISRNVISNFGAYAIDLENAQNSLIFGNDISNPTLPTLQGIMIVALADPGNTISCSNISVVGNNLTNFPDRAINLVAWAQDATSNATLQDVNITGNTVTGNFYVLNDWKLGSGINIVRNLSIIGNNFTVNNPKASGYAIDISDVAGSVLIDNNTIGLTGAMQPGASFFHGLNIGGANSQTIAISNNNFDGGDLGLSNVAIRLRSTLPATAILNIFDCDITRFGVGVRTDALLSGCAVAIDHCGIYDNPAGGLVNGAGAPVIADHNWWGSYCGPYHSVSNPDGGGNFVSDNAVYDPWCEPSFTSCNFSNSVAPPMVWIDDGYTIDGFNDGHYWCYDAFNNIQEGIDKVADGGTVNVMVGIYTAQLVINKSVSLVGNGLPVIQCPAGTLNYYTLQENSARFEPIIFAYGGANNGSGYISGPGTIEVTVTGFTIDGNNSGSSNRFNAILFRNCLNSVISYNDIYGMLYSSGSPMTFGVLVYGNSDVLVDHNNVTDFTRNGITANGDGGALRDPIAVISNNTVVGEGELPQGNWAQNGIQIGYAAEGAILGNEVSDIATLDPSWSASALILYDAAPNVIIRRNNVHDCQATLNAYYSDGIVVDSNIFNGNDFTYILGADNITFTGNALDSNRQAIYLGDITNSSINGNNLSYNEVGIVADGSCDNLLVADNELIGNTIAGIVVQPYGTSPNNVTVTGNCIYGNAFGISNATANMIHAAGNWWGDIAGPIVTTVESERPRENRPPECSLADQLVEQPAGREAVKRGQIPDTQVVQAKQAGDDVPRPLLIGDQISTLVDYSPWWGADYHSDPHSSSWTWYQNLANSSTIQEVVNLASAGDRIQVMPGIYAGDGNRNIDFAGKDLMLFSAAGTDETIIDCESAARAFHFHSGESSGTRIYGFTVKNGYTAGNGGAVLCENGSSPQFGFCLFLNNRADGNGGAFYCDQSAPRLVNNTIIWNSASGLGGGIGITNADPILTNVLLWQDTSSSGAEISLNGGNPLITYCDIEGGWPGEGNLDCNPRLCDPISGNFHFSDISCCYTGGLEGTYIGAFDLGCVGDFIPGDVNASGQVNGLDVIFLIGYFKDSGYPIPPPIWRADANGNCLVNGIDVVFLVSYLKGIGSPPRDGNCQGWALSSETTNNAIGQSEVELK